MKIEWVKIVGDEWGVGVSRYHPRTDTETSSEYRTFGKEWRHYPSGDLAVHMAGTLDEAVARHCAIAAWRRYDEA